MNMCKSSKRSVLINESTDISVSQMLAVIVRFFNYRQCTVVDALLDLLTTVQMLDCTGILKISLFPMTFYRTTLLALLTTAALHHIVTDTEVLVRGPVHVL